MTTALFPRIVYIVMLEVVVVYKGKSSEFVIVAQSKRTHRHTYTLTDTHTHTHTHTHTTEKLDLIQPGKICLKML